MHESSEEGEDYQNIPECLKSPASQEVATRQPPNSNPGLDVDSSQESVNIAASDADIQSAEKVAQSSASPIPNTSETKHKKLHPTGPQKHGQQVESFSGVEESNRDQSPLQANIMPDSAQTLSVPSTSTQNTECGEENRKEKRLDELRKMYTREKMLVSAQKMTCRLVKRAFYLKNVPERMVSIAWSNELNREEINSSLSKLLEDFRCDKADLSVKLLNMPPQTIAKLLNTAKDLDAVYPDNRLLLALLRIFVESPNNKQDLEIWQQSPEEMRRIAEKESHILLEHLKSERFYSNELRKEVIEIALKPELSIKQIKEKFEQVRCEKKVYSKELGIKLLNMSSRSATTAFSRLINIEDEKWKTLEMTKRLQLAFISKWLDTPNNVNLMRNWKIGDSSENNAVPAKRPKRKSPKREEDSSSTSK